MTVLRIALLGLESLLKYPRDRVAVGDMGPDHRNSNHRRIMPLKHPHKIGLAFDLRLRFLVPCEIVEATHFAISS